ncbi:hypothetical protein XELAEV_18000548mg [Xenopus laevis]|nr:hypothetical protein XELAEV_18000548mg [Xenopus laevis]
MDSVTSSDVVGLGTDRVSEQGADAGVSMGSCRAAVEVHPQRGTSHAGSFRERPRNQGAPAHGVAVEAAESALQSSSERHSALKPGAKEKAVTMRGEGVISAGHLPTSDAKTAPSYEGKAAVAKTLFLEVKDSVGGTVCAAGGKAKETACIAGEEAGGTVYTAEGQATDAKTGLADGAATIEYEKIITALKELKCLAAKQGALNKETDIIINDLNLLKGERRACCHQKTAVLSNDAGKEGGEQVDNKEQSQLDRNVGQVGAVTGTDSTAAAVGISVWGRQRLQKRNQEEVMEEEYGKRQNVVKMKWVKERADCPGRRFVGRRLIKEASGFTPDDIFALLSITDAEFDVSFQSAQGLEEFWWRIIDEEGFWVGGYKAQVKLHSEGYVQKHLPNSFYLWKDRGVCYYVGQQRLCFNCGSKFHHAGKCNVQRCAFCGETGHVSKACERQIQCNLCLKSGHAYKNCPEAWKNIRKSCPNTEELMSRDLGESESVQDTAGPSTSTEGSVLPPEGQERPRREVYMPIRDKGRGGEDWKAVGKETRERKKKNEAQWETDN